MQGLANQDVVERLRERIRRLQAAPRQYLSVIRTGIEPFDRLFPSGGLPLGHAVELCGEAASGRTSLALRALAAAHREGRLCAYVDGPRELYPPAAAALGVDLSRLLVLRPKAPKELPWTAVQLLRSGAFACVALDLTHTCARLSLPEVKKLIDAAAQGGSLLLTLTAAEAPAEGMSRVRTRAIGKEGLCVELVHSRLGGLGRKATLSWEALYPVAELWPRPAWALPEAQRPARPLRLAFSPDPGREGPCGIHAQRPGRDMPFSPLADSLGG